MVRLVVVRYHRAADRRRDHEQQVSRGGILVRAEPPPDLMPFDPVQLELIGPGALAVRLRAEVLQLFPGTGVAVKFDPTGVGDLTREGAETADDADLPVEYDIHATGTSAPPPRPSADTTSTEPSASSERRSPSSRAAPTPIAKLAAASTTEKIQIALYGSRDERALILRDINKALHVHLLRNPGLMADEVLAMARMTQVSVELLQGIADRREWSQRPDVAIALVRNPKTPVPTALRLLDHVSPHDLRQVAKDAHTRAPIQQAARKKQILG